MFIYRLVCFISFLFCVCVFLLFFGPCFVSRCGMNEATTKLARHWCTHAYTEHNLKCVIARPRSCFQVTNLFSVCRSLVHFAGRDASARRGGQSLGRRRLRLRRLVPCHSDITFRTRKFIEKFVTGAAVIHMVRTHVLAAAKQRSQHGMTKRSLHARTAELLFGQMCVCNLYIKRVAGEGKLWPCQWRSTQQMTTLAPGKASDAKRGGGGQRNSGKWKYYFYYYWRLRVPVRVNRKKRKENGGGAWSAR